ncbi:MAG TPA: RsmE family RNA methyltransferase, partial [Gemmata sp.]
VSAVEKFERAVIEASKQCGRNRLMQVDPPQKWEAFVARADLPTPRAVLHTGTGLAQLGPNGGTVAVGPEGGFTPEEIAVATANEWAIMSLGPRVLRVETAAIAAAALLGVSTSSG